MMRNRVMSGGLAALVVCAGGVGVATSRAAAGHAAVTPTTINVSAYEFHYKLSKTFITKPGTVIFKIKNTGQVAHNFVILSGINKTTPLIQKGKTATLKVVFKKKGKYTYECTVGEHATEGMLGHFIVK
jgi:plastocyanin